MRPTLDEYFLEMAKLVSTRSTCLRRKVGAVIVKDKHIICTGYNGVPSGLPHCEEVGCLRNQLNIPSGERMDICKALHAEQNALMQAAKLGESVEDSTIYVTCSPCFTCLKLIISAGIKKIVYIGEYPDENSNKLAKEADIELIKIDI